MGQDKFTGESCWPKIRLERITPVAAGVNPNAVVGFLDQMKEKKIHLHSFLMLKGDRVFAEGSYSPCKADDVHMLFSLSKSFTAMAVGFAVQEHRLSLTDLVVDFFREEPWFPREMDENRKNMSVRHLLTMNTGHVDPKDDSFKDMAANWSRDFIEDPAEREPGSWFLYHTRATYMLSVILQKVTGETVFQYLRPRLFEPLGFSKDIWWEISPEGYDAGGFGLNLPVEDIAKFGVLLLNKGTFQGKRILERSWFEEAVMPWSDTSITWGGENKYGYGYQLWRCHIPNSFRGDGAFGQYCVILPDQNMVFAATAGQRDMQKILDVYWDQIFSGLGRELPLEAELKEAQRELERRLSMLTLNTFYEEKGIQERCLEVPNDALDKVYQIQYNPLKITELCIHKCEDGREGEYRIRLTNGKKQDLFQVSSDRWVEGRLHVDGAYTEKNKWCFRTGLFEHFYVKGCSKENILYLDMFFPETSFQDTWKLTFEEDGITLKVERNTGFDEIRFCVRGSGKDIDQEN